MQKRTWFNIWSYRWPKSDWYEHGEKFTKLFAKKTLLIGEKKVGEKWLNFLQVTKVSLDKFFRTVFFQTSVFTRIFFTGQRIYPDFVFNYYYDYYYFRFICKIYHYHVFLCTWLIVVDQCSFNKNFEMQVKARNLKK